MHHIICWKLVVITYLFFIVGEVTALSMPQDFELLDSGSGSDLSYISPTFKTEMLVSC